MNPQIQKPMDTTPEKAAIEQDFEPIPKFRPPFELWAQIKKSSKYYCQGLVILPGKKPVARKFPITSIQHCDPLDDSYIFGMNGNRYRREDIQLFVKLGNNFQRL